MVSSPGRHAVILAALAACVSCVEDEERPRSLADGSSSLDKPSLPDLPKPDLPKPDLSKHDLPKPDGPKHDSPPSDFKPPDLPWNKCPFSGYQALCEKPGGGAKCCAGSGAYWDYWCPPGYGCGPVFDCWGWKFDAGEPTCPVGSFCKSMSGCSCTPASGSPCSNCGACVKVCPSPIPTC